MQQEQAQALAEKQERESERRRQLAEAARIEPPAIKPGAASMYETRSPRRSPPGHEKGRLRGEAAGRRETLVASDGGMQQGKDGSSELAVEDDWLSSLRAETAQRPRRKSADQDGEREQEQREGPGPAVVASDGAWSPPPSPPLRRRAGRAAKKGGACTGAGAACLGDGGRGGGAGGRTGVGRGAPSDGQGGLLSSKPLAPAPGPADAARQVAKIAKMGRREDPVGKGISAEVEMMLEEVMARGCVGNALCVTKGRAAVLPCSCISSSD